MSVASLIPPVLNSLVGNRAWMDTTPDADLARDPTTKRILPFILLSVMGGEDAEYVDQTMGNKTHARLQVSCYDPDSEAVEALSKAVCDRLLASEYTVGVLGSPVGTYDAARKLRVRFQQFSVWLPR